MEEGYDILNNNDYAMAFMSLFTFITAGPYHEFIEAAEAAIPLVRLPLRQCAFYITGILIVKEGSSSRSSSTRTCHSLKTIGPVVDENIGKLDQYAPAKAIIMQKQKDDIRHVPGGRL